MMQQQYYDQGMVSPQVQPVSQDEIYANMIQEERVKNIISQISPQMYLTDIRMTLKGYYKNELKQKWERVDDSVPEPHPLLVSRYMAFLSSIINHNTVLGNLSERQITKIMKIVIEYIADDLDANSDEYGIGEQYTERTRIGQIMINSIFMVLLRALNGQEARRMWGSLSMNESMNPMGNSMQQNKSKFWQFWK